MRALLTPSLLVLAEAGCSEAPHPLLHEQLRADEAYGRPSVPAGRAPFTATCFNAYIMQAATAFGAASYLWQGDGVTRTVSYQGSVVAKPYAAGKCHCVGGSFQVHMSAFEVWDQQYAGGRDANGASAACSSEALEVCSELPRRQSAATSAREEPRSGGE